MWSLFFFCKQKTAYELSYGLVGSEMGIRASLVIFELQAQRREFLAWLAVLVFFLLPFGYGASGVVELVGHRDGLPRAAPWAVAQAMAGLTAFGQVITAMIAATTVLRDVTLRKQGLILTTPLPWPNYMLGRVLGCPFYTSDPADHCTGLPTCVTPCLNEHNIRTNRRTSFIMLRF